MKNIFKQPLHLISSTVLSKTGSPPLKNDEIGITDLSIPIRITNSTNNRIIRKISKSTDCPVSKEYILKKNGDKIRGTKTKTKRATLDVSAVDVPSPVSTIFPKAHGY